MVAIPGILISDFGTVFCSWALGPLGFLFSSHQAIKRCNFFTRTKQGSQKELKFVSWLREI